MLSPRSSRILRHLDLAELLGNGVGSRFFDDQEKSLPTPFPRRARKRASNVPRVRRGLVQGNGKASRDNGRVRRRGNARRLGGRGAAESRSRCGRDAPRRMRALHRDGGDVRSNDSRRASRRVTVDAMAPALAGAAGDRRNGRCSVGAGASPRFASDDDSAVHPRPNHKRLRPQMRRSQPRRPRQRSKRRGRATSVGIEACGCSCEARRVDASPAPVD